MSNNEIDQQIAQKMRAIFSDPAAASRITNLAVSKRPPGVSHKTYLPYYKEYWGFWIKGQIDAMIMSKQTLIFDYKTFCSDGMMSKNTLYQKVNQAIRYLIDNMDTPELSYLNWRKIVHIHRVHPKYEGVVIEFIPEVIAGLDPTNLSGGRLIVPKDDTTPKWKQELDMWMESDSSKPFLREGLALTETEVKELKIELSEIRGISSSITATHVKVMKINI